MNSIISETYVRQSLTEARYFEFCADADQAEAILAPILKELTEERRQLTTLNPRLSCEILLVYGSVISFQGLTKKEKYLQETAMDFLTEARGLAFETGERDLISETEKQIGLCYWRLGQHENALTYFDSVLERYTTQEQQTNSVCLGTQTNIIGVNFDLKNAAGAKLLLEKIEPFVNVCGDDWLRTRFYTEAASAHLTHGDLDRAIPFLKQAIELSKITKNDVFLANALNNLALVYINTGDAVSARKYIERAIKIFSAKGQVFTLAMALETKAQILIAANDLVQARITIDESIAILEKSENYLPLAESLWTRIVIMAQTGEKVAVIKDFSTLTNLVRTHLSEDYVNSYLEKFTGLIYIESGRNFYEKTENYRRHLLDNALAASNGKVLGVAQALGISHQNTSLLLKKYPDLCEKHAVKLRTRVTDAFLPKRGKIKKISDDSFAIRLQSDRLAYLGLDKGKIISVQICPLSDLDLSRPVVIQDKEKKYNCGFLVDAFEMYAFEDGRGNLEKTFLSDDIIESGQVSAVFDSEKETFIPLEDLLP